MNPPADDAQDPTRRWSTAGVAVTIFLVGAAFLAATLIWPRASRRARPSSSRPPRRRR